MRKRWIGPVAGVVSLVVWLGVVYFWAEISSPALSYFDGLWVTLLEMLLLWSPVYLIAGSAAGLLCQHGIRRLKTRTKTSHLAGGGAALLLGVLVFLAAAAFIFVGVWYMHAMIW